MLSARQSAKLTRMLMAYRGTRDESIATKQRETLLSYVNNLIADQSEYAARIVDQIAAECQPDEFVGGFKAQMPQLHQCGIVWLI